MDQDKEHLRLLTIFHYIVGGITALCACFPLIHLVIGLTLVFAPDRMGGSAHPGPDRLVGWMFTLLAGVFIILGWALAISTAYAGRCLARREKHTFCLVVAGANCLNTPIGTVLGVFTIIVLVRPSVKELFTANERESLDAVGTWPSST